VAPDLWTIFWLTKTSNKPISLTTWLAVDPYLVILNQCVKCDRIRMTQPWVVDKVFMAYPATSPLT